MRRVLLAFATMVLLVGCGEQADPMLSVTVSYQGGSPAANATVCIGQGTDEQCGTTDENGVADVDVSSMPSGYYNLYVWNPGAPTDQATSCVTNGSVCSQVLIPGNGESPTPQQVTINP